MSTPPRSPGARRDTPALDRLLDRVRARLRLAAWLHGMGMVLAALAATVAFAFIADWLLSVPRPVRLWHAFLVFAVPTVAAWFFVWRVLRRIPGRSGLALFAESAAPDSDELLVSAVDFQREPTKGDDDELRVALVDRVLERADQRAARLDIAPLFDFGPPLKRLAAGFLACVAIASAFAMHPEYAHAFFSRLAGASTPWPNATELVLDVPLAEGAARVTRLANGAVAVEAARGTDIPVVVRARGKAPREIVLDFGDGRRVGVARVGGSESRGGVYRTVLRGVQEDLRVVARGGDDQSGRARLELTVLQPPEILGLALHVEPPPHTGLPSEWVYDRGARVIWGSRITVALRTDPVDVTGRVRLLPEDAVIELGPRPYPGADALEGLGFVFDATTSVRLRFEVSDRRGLSNPDPGLFAIDVVPDRAPEVEQIAPARSDIETGVNGAIALRVRAEDDFGLTRFGWRSRDAAVEGSERRADLPLEGTVGPSGRTRTAVAALRIDVADLVEPGARPSVGRQFQIEAFAEDNAEPPKEGKSPGVRVRILGDDELLRRVQDRLARARVQASSLATLQRERRARVADLIDALGGDGAEERDEIRQVSSVLTGQRRVTSDSEALLRELTAVLELALYARLDDKAGPLLERLDELLSAQTQRGYQIAPWRDFLAWHAEHVTVTAGFAAHLVGLSSLGLAVHEQGTARAVEALESAYAATDRAARRAALVRADAAQADALRRLEDLLERLSEWDDFQSVLTQTREMLERQRAVRERTRRFANER